MPSSGWTQDAAVGSGCGGQDVLGYCGDQFSKGAKSTFSTDRDEYVERTKTVREVVGNCYDCALERIRRDIERLEDSLRHERD